MSARANNRELLFLDGADYQRYLKLLAWVIELTGWRCLSYCLMPNHVHLLLETPVPNLAQGMQRLHGTYAVKLNARHGRRGHLFQGRYDAVTIRVDAQFWMATRYVARNPVKAGLCVRPDDWPWSSDQAVITASTPPWFAIGRLMELLSSAGGDPLERYLELTRSC